MPEMPWSSAGGMLHTDGRVVLGSEQKRATADTSSRGGSTHSGGNQRGMVKPTVHAWLAGEGSSVGSGNGSGRGSAYGTATELESFGRRRFTNDRPSHGGVPRVLSDRPHLGGAWRQQSSMGVQLRDGGSRAALLLTENQAERVRMILDVWDMEMRHAEEMRQKEREKEERRLRCLEWRLEHQQLKQQQQQQQE